MHLPFFYSRIHKIHHEDYNVITMSLSHMHPVEFIFEGMIPMMASLMILKHRIHILTVSCWVAYRVFAAVGNHSGYEFPWSMFKVVPFGLDAPDHHWHHSKNDGNYGSFTIIWDVLFGTMSKIQIRGETIKTHMKGTCQIAKKK